MAGSLVMIDPPHQFKWSDRLAICIVAGATKTIIYLKRKNLFCRNP